MSKVNYRSKLLLISNLDRAIENDLRLENAAEAVAITRTFRIRRKENFLCGRLWSHGEKSTGGPTGFYTTNCAVS